MYWNKEKQEVSKYDIGYPVARPSFFEGLRNLHGFYNQNIRRVDFGFSQDARGMHKDFEFVGRVLYDTMRDFSLNHRG